jgi:hypothetical protein
MIWIKTTMIVNAVNAVVSVLAGHSAGEKVQLMVLPCQGGGQLGCVRSNTPDGYRMKRLPREYRDSHNLQSFLNFPKSELAFHYLCSLSIRKELIISSRQLDLLNNVVVN